MIFKVKLIQYSVSKTEQWEFRHLAFGQKVLYSIFMDKYMRCFPCALSEDSGERKFIGV